MLHASICLHDPFNINYSTIYNNIFICKYFDRITLAIFIKNVLKIGDVFVTSELDE